MFNWLLEVPFPVFMLHVKLQKGTFSSVSFESVMFPLPPFIYFTPPILKQFSSLSFSILPVPLPLRFFIDGAGLLSILFFKTLSCSKVQH